MEKDLSVKRQFIDVIILEQEGGEAPQNLPDGLDNLGPHNLLTYKSLREPLDGWAMDELLGHYVNYRKQISPTLDDLLPENDFCLYAVCTRFPQKLSSQMTLHDVCEGVYEVRWGLRRIRIIVLSKIPPTPNNALWDLFSANPEKVQYGAHQYHWRIPDHSTTIYRLYEIYNVEGMDMAYTYEDFYRDFTKQHLNWLTMEERLHGISTEAIEAYLQKQRQKEEQQGISSSGMQRNAE